MTTDSEWGIAPRESIELECSRRGRAEVVASCRAMLRGEPVDDDLLLALGGPAASKFLDGGSHRDTYWLRVWGARGLLWAWDDSASDDIRRALEDEAWRVREMAVRVIARHRLGGLVEEVAGLSGDPNAQVRQAADRAVVLLVSAQS